jgi:carboxypeptidase family protein
MVVCSARPGDSSEVFVTRYLSLVSLSFSSVALALTFALSVFAQTATGTIVGTVTDKTGAAVAGAEIELSDDATNNVIKVVADEDGRYVFLSVLPSYYTITAAKQGFNKTIVAGLKVDVTKSCTVNVTLETGDAQQTVQVKARTETELQAGDSLVGNVFSGQLLPRAPALTRQANELIRYQPLVTPDGAIAGARQDQSTFLLDGIDVTDNAGGGIDAFRLLPVESVDEFRVGVANSDASFGRGSGGQISVVSRRGGSAFHGGAYWYHQNDALNAASWTNKRTLGQDISDPTMRHRIQEPELKDNRFGGSFGGPYPWWENTFFFLNYEGRRFPRATEFNRLVATDTLKQGVLRFRDAAGDIVSYNLASANNCGPGTDVAPATGACDPRALGISPAISTLLSGLPVGNDPSLGDGLNTIGYRGTVRSALSSGFYSVRADRNFSDNWRFDASFRYLGERNEGADHISILGGNNASLENFDARQNLARVGMTGQLTDRTLGAFALGWTRTRVSTIRLRPDESAARLALPGTDNSAGNVAVNLAGLDEPFDLEGAANQAFDSRNIQLNADFNSLKGAHTLQYGSHLRYLPARYARDDKGGNVSALMAQLGSGSLQIPDALRPPTCNEVTTVNCLQPGDEARWNQLYASSLGLVDNINTLVVRDEHFDQEDFGVLPLGSQLVTDTRSFAPEFYLQDVWRVRPSFTLTYGLNYGWQTPPRVKGARMTIMVDSETLTPFTAQEYLRARDEAARRGEIYNPAIAFQPVNDAERSAAYDTDWNNVSPRASAAWNPNFSGGLLGKLFGEGKTVIRGGYSLIYDRFNTFQNVVLPTQGLAFAQMVNLAAPLCDAGIEGGGTNCASDGANIGLNGFRFGVDGAPPIPDIPDLSKPYSPNTTNPNADIVLFPEAISFQVDPKIEVGQSHAFDFTWQRELPGGMIIEAGYVGRYAKKLPQNISLSQVPYQHLDTASNQTFAQAFDALATQLRGGVAAANVTPQRWFENQLSGTALCGSAGGCTAGLAAAQSANIINGDVSNVFLTIDKNRIANGMQPFNNYLAQAFILRTSAGRSNYNAGFATVRKRFSQGLLFTANYTFSRALDQLGALQSSTSLTPNSFDLDAEYGPSSFDITHQFNATGIWELPFGNGRRFSFSSDKLDRVIGGWHSSWIFTWQRGTPLIVTQGAGVWGGGFDQSSVSGAIPITDTSSINTGVNKGVGSRSGINLFEDPAQVYSNFRQVLLSSDGRSGRANPLRGLPYWNLDMSLGKKTTIMENKTLTFSAEFFNLFNHVNYANPSLDLTNPAAFGVITEQFTPPNRSSGSRWIQLGMRLEF